MSREGVGICVCICVCCVSSLLSDLLLQVSMVGVTEKASLEDVQDVFIE